ncbi:hypothetical protein CEXT_54981, partial [Caerostris extrusa]
VWEGGIIVARRQRRRQVIRDVGHKHLTSVGWVVVYFWPE